MTSPSYNSQWATTGQWLNDSESSEENPPEYYIHATVTSTGQTLKSEQLTPPAGKFSLLNVTKMGVSEGICLDPYSQTPKIFSCADYDEANCNSIDVCNVTEDVYCPGNLVVKENHGCIWDPNANSGDGLCVETYESFACPICGNGLQELGEECDGSNFINPNTDDNYTCEDFGGTGGDLTCNSQCKIVNTCDGINCNPDGIVQFPGEECDPQGLGNFTKFNKTTGEIIGEWSCTDYDTYDDEGSLVCGNDCLIQRQCTFDEDPDGTGRASDGSCVKSETLISDCNEGTIGVYEVKVKGNWTWGTSYNSKTDCVSAGNPSANCINDTPTSWHYSSTGDLTPRTSCEQEKSNNIPCPAQIRLPFFGGLQMIITLFAIAAIYGLMAVERKKK